MCFNDSNYSVFTVPAIVNISCSTKAQYVIYYNEIRPGVKYPEYKSTYAKNMLCEVEVYGKLLNWLCLIKYLCQNISNLFFRQFITYMMTSFFEMNYIVDEFIIIYFIFLQILIFQAFTVIYHISNDLIRIECILF